jgi:hypothetical protein
MIRYAFTEDELIADIEADDLAKGRKQPWLKKAKKWTAELKKKPSKAISSHWSEIKSVYTKRQHGKCAFCERLLGAHELASGEFDVEHFRPKSAVTPWPTPEIAAELNLPQNFPSSAGSGPGYRMLAYHPLNYASSCKTCNSRLKSSFFPIAGTHDCSGEDPAALNKAEQPYLIYPLADFDDDPELLIGFQGFLAVPQPNTKGYRHDRARVTIAFFRLNKEREDLLELRAKTLEDVYTKLELLELTKAKKKREELWNDVLRLRADNSHHAGCVRSLLTLYGHPDDKPVPATRSQAIEYLELARAYWRSKHRP